MVSFNLGESVSLLTETGVFTIIEINPLKACIKDEFGISRWVPNNQLVKRKSVNGPIHQKDNPTVNNSKRKTRPHKIPQIDLHAEALNIPVSQEMLPIKIELCRNFLNQCIQNRQAKALIIHGVGEGILKNAVRQMLRGKSGVIFHDGNYSMRGVGSTLVEMQLNIVKSF